MPIVAVKYIREKINNRQDFQNSAREKCHPLAVVKLPVDIGTVELEFIIYKIVCQTLRLILKNTAILLTPGIVYIKMRDICAFVSH